MRLINRALICGSLVLGLALTGCSTKGGTSGANQTGKDGVKYDYGVTDDSITLGAMTDQSGAFKVIGLGITQGQQIWVDDVNKAGGICGRDIKLDIQDNGYHADKALTLYASMKDKVAGMVQVLGSPIAAALKPQLESDDMLSIPASWASGNLESKALLQVGATYAIEMVNGMAYAQKSGLIADGDKIGHIYVDGEYGGDGLSGSKAYAKQHNQTIVPAKVTGEDSDLTPAVTSLKSAGVKAVLITTTPTQTGSILTAMSAQGMSDVPVVGNGPSFAPTLLDTPAKDSFANYYRVVPYLPFNAPQPITQHIAESYHAKFTDKPQDAVEQGYSFAMAYEAVLTKACKNKDLTRKGILDAARQVKVDTKGLTAPLDYSKPGQPPTRATYIEQVDTSVEGGLKIVDDISASQEAKDLKVGK
ncbi:ABC-type branched-subunit amino acid transport system substrate-binding protein [Antricoccus suffuscus]|uniref:ABC-type branched-subunit amino acid transport system substrate-binding protein n=1 Tax=Antricoccus suffuscus TaxID=1629062 RepID=A0A2T0ZVS5_9ACTN|nr:ABC transporter substrate-binding protein [Antricoccus suffuscus]PRZ40449.1 ABC-type branched-subunit amino acid transport system substrate-binding protein [Antricoccus suffuscus]